MSHLFNILNHDRIDILVPTKKNAPKYIRLCTELVQQQYICSWLFCCYNLGSDGAEGQCSKLRSNAVSSKLPLQLRLPNEA